MELKKQLFLIKPKRVLLFVIAFTTLLLLGLFFPTLSAFIILPKWMSLPGFIGFSQTSEFKNLGSTGDGIDKIDNIFLNSSFNSKTLNSSSEQEIVLPRNFGSLNDVRALSPSSDQEIALSRNFSSFHDDGTLSPSSEQEIALSRNFSSFRDVGENRDQERANASVERYGNISKEVSTHSSLIIAKASFTASTNPPLSMDIHGSNSAPSKQNSRSGDGRVIEDTAVEIVSPHKGNEGGAACNLFDGKWVFDNSYPVYRTRSCSFIDEAFDCEGNGRGDLSYMKWRWQPKDCNLPKGLNCNKSTGICAYYADLYEYAQ